MKPSIDQKKIAFHIREILLALGEDPDRDGLKETPERVARMYAEMFRGIAYSNQELAEKYAKTFDAEDMCTPMQGNYVVIRNIPVFSFCEHHLALMYNMHISVIYRPDKRVIGLSKIARIAEMVCHRLQLQERIGTDIAEILQLSTGSQDVGVIVEGEHSCMTARGIKKPGSLTRSSFFRGCFEYDPIARREALLLLLNEDSPNVP